MARFQLLFFLLVLAARSSKTFASLSEPWKEGTDEEELGTKNRVKDYVFGSLWPKPQSYNDTRKVYTLTPTEFSLDATGEISDVLKEAFTRYTSLIFPDPSSKPKPGLPQITALQVKVEEKYAPLTLESDESYTLVVKAPSSTLAAKSVWGALRGLETFSQVVHQDESGLYLANGSTIMDHPRFRHRGFMIDTARHYLETSVILKFIDAMSYSKFNVLHWHVTDDQSFPFVSETFPELSGQGAWNNKTHIYTKDDVRNILEYARLRGVRVVPEFDTPGHSDSWASIPDLLTPCYSKGEPTGSYGPMNPTLDSTFTFIKSFFSEVATRFPDPFLHLGGDEVRQGCWSSNPNVSAWMEKMGYGQNYSLLQQYYEENLMKIVGGLGKSYIVWQEAAIKTQVLPGTVVNIWKGGYKGALSKITARGLRAILSSCWYLSHIHFGEDWTQYYQCDPTDFTGTDKQKELVIGGTGCMWGEYVDGDNLLPRTWPRAFAIGERLWSSNDTTDLNDAKMRLWEHRCRYVRRGIPAENGIRAKYCRYEWRFN